jgi:PAS domain S-box-containing protein
LAEKALRDERQQTLEALRTSEERFARAFRASPAALSISRLADGTFIDVNDAFLRLFGYERSEVLGRTAAELGLWSDAAVRDGLLRRLRERQQVRDVESTLRTRSGEPREVLIALELVELDGAPCVLAMKVDITARKRAEQERLELARAQAARAEAETAHRRAAFLARASQLLTSSLDYEATLRRLARLAVPELADMCLVDIVDDDGAIQRLAVAHADPAEEARMARLLGRYPPRPDAAYGPPAVLRTGRPELLDDVGMPIEELFPLVAAGRDAAQLELLRRVPFVSRMVVPLVARGRVLGAVMLLSTDPSRRYGPAELALAEDLAGRAAMAVDNARLYQQAQQSLRAREELERQKDEFLAIISHDLKTPLTGIKGWAQMARRLADRLADPGARAVHDAVRTIEQIADRASALIDELMDVARLQKGELLELRREPMDLAALVRDVIDESQQRTDRHVIRLDWPGGPLEGEWDRARLSRVLDNLLTNAIKYSPDGGTITVALGREEHGTGAWAVLSVCDEGVGIPAAEVGRVFERSFRGSNVVGKIDGTGLGLTGARPIVEQHGGTIAVESREGRGSTFTVRLPVHAEEPAAAATAGTAARSTRRRESRLRR